jgi:TRAP transporter TAXI family solute receptor
MGEPGSGTITDARLVLDAAGLSECDIKPNYLRLSQAVEALEHDQIDAFFIVAGAPVPAVADIAAMTPIRLIPVEGSASEKLGRRMPPFTPGTIAGGTYPGIDEAVATVGLMAQWIVADSVPEQLVYAITRALWQDTTRRLLDGAHPAGKRIRLATALTGLSLPLHPGAARFYREAGMDVPDR